MIDVGEDISVLVSFLVSRGGFLMFCCCRYKCEKNAQGKVNNALLLSQKSYVMYLF